MKTAYTFNLATTSMKWKGAILTTLFALPAFAANAQVGIGTVTPDASAQLDVKSDARGVLVPRLTSVQRTGIANPADGLLVYDTDTKGFWYFKSGTGWTDVNNPRLALPYADTGNNAAPLFSITNQGTGAALEGIASGTGTALDVSATGTGRAARFNNNNVSNTNEVIQVKTIGNGIAGSFMVDQLFGTSPAVRGEVNSQFSNFGTAGVMGISSGTHGYGGIFHSTNPAGKGPGIVALTEGDGDAVVTNAGGDGDGVEASVDGAGNAIYGWVPNFGTGRAGRFANNNSGNANPAVHITNAGTGSGLLVNHTGSGGNPAIFQSGGANVARINKAGVGFFNGGTQNTGADIAEAFDVVADVSAYEPGDVLSIATSRDRTIEKSAGAYSSLVLGVYATKPGVLLTEENIDSDLTGKVPMGVVGVIPTKVCLEGGVIRRGDLLVTSSLPGVAMKADKAKVQAGQVLGKALQNFDCDGIGKINVFVNVK